MGDNIPDCAILLKGIPESLNLKCIIKLTKSIIVTDLAQHFNVHMITEHKTREDLIINRLEVSCQGNRFAVCTDWQNFHVSCFASRAFQMLCDKVLFGIDWVNSTELEDLRKTVEDKFKIRLLSTIDGVNTCKDNRLVCARFHKPERRRECFECFTMQCWKNTSRRNWLLELIYDDYWNKHDLPMRRYFKAFETLYKAIQDWEYEEHDKEMKLQDQEFEQDTEKRGK